MTKFLHFFFPALNKLKRFELFLFIYVIFFYFFLSLLVTPNKIYYLLIFTHLPELVLFTINFHPYLLMLILIFFIIYNKKKKQINKQI